MGFSITQQDVEIFRGIQELQAVGPAGVESDPMRVLQSQRTMDIYTEIAATIDTQRELEEEGL